MLTKTQRDTYRIFASHFGYDIEVITGLPTDELHAESAYFAEDYNAWLDGVGERKEDRYADPVKISDGFIEFAGVNRK